MSAVAGQVVGKRAHLQNEVNTLEASCSEFRLLLIHSDMCNAESIQWEERVHSLEVELTRCRAAYKKLQDNVKYIVETPMGLCKLVHAKTMKNVDELARGLGFVK